MSFIFLVIPIFLILTVAQKIYENKNKTIAMICITYLGFPEDHSEYSKKIATMFMKASGIKNPLRTLSTMIQSAKVTKIANQSSF